MLSQILKIIFFSPVLKYLNSKIIKKLIKTVEIIYHSLPSAYLILENFISRPPPIFRKKLYTKSKRIFFF